MTDTDRPTRRYTPPAIAARQIVVGLLRFDAVTSDPGLPSAHFGK